MQFGMQFLRSADPQFSNTQQIDPDFLHCFVLIDLFLANEHAKILTCVLSDWTLQFCFVHIHIENFTQVVVVEKVRLSKIHFGHWDAVFTRKI